MLHKGKKFQTGRMNLVQSPRLYFGISVYQECPNFCPMFGDFKINFLADLFDLQTYLSIENHNGVNF